MSSAACASSRSRSRSRTASAPASCAVRRCSGVEKNPFASSGRRGRGAGGAQVVPGAAEALVDEHGDGGGARALVGRGELGRIRVRADVAERGRAALDLGDRGRARASRERVPKPHGRTSRAPRAGRRRRRSRPPCAASSSPSRRSSARPAAAIAPAALSRIASRAPPSAPAKIVPDGRGRSPPASRRAAPRARSAAMPSSSGSISRSMHARRRRPRRRGSGRPARARRCRAPRGRRTRAARRAGRAPPPSVRHELGRVDADHLRPRAGRVRERAEHVEHGTRRELAPDRCRVAHRRVVGGREHEAEAELVDRARDPLGRLLEREAERLEHVGGAGGRRHGAVAVLRDPRAGRRRHDRRRRRDVERVRAVAARPGRVDEVVALRPHRQDVLAHRLRAAGDLVRRLALRRAARRGSRRSAPASPRRA